MGSVGQDQSSNMKAFFCIALVSAASVASSDSVSNTAQSGLASHLGQGAVVGGVAHGVVGHGLSGHGLAHGVVGHGIAHPVAHAVAHPVAHAVAEVYPDEISPFTYQYAVADDYSGSNFQAAETDDGTAARTGSYSVALPDGRVQ